jgi:hypothetical protein
MALGDYRYRYPVLASLGDLGQSIRQATADALSRRRLDLQEQALLTEAEQSRDIAGLLRLAQEQAGETTLLKTKSDIQLQQEADRRAERSLQLQEKADVRGRSAPALAADRSVSAAAGPDAAARRTREYAQ